MSIIRGIAVTSAALMASTVVAQSADLYGGHGGRGSIKDDYTYAAAPTRLPDLVCPRRRRLLRRSIARR